MGIFHFIYPATQKACQKYCLLFKSSKHGIERLEICESKDDKNPRIITLENCVKITQELSPINLIHIVKKTGTLTLNTLTEYDLKEWLNALQKVAFRDKSETRSAQATAIEEDNDLYCSSYGDGLFVVTLIPSDASIRCNIDPKVYMLHLSTIELQLKSVDDINNIVANWPYRFIRKYGYRDGKFTFEAGRKCSTGEGVFTLDHTNPQEVFRCMSAKMKSMKKLISADATISNTDGGENQLNIAASMEPGSRSPLPPSPSNVHSANEFEIASSSTQSCLSIRAFKSSSDSLNNCSINSLPSLMKVIPNKPPRKITLPHPPPNALNEQIPTCTPSSSITASDIFRKHKSYDPVSITTTVDPNKTIGSAVLLKPSTSPIKCNEGSSGSCVGSDLVTINKDRDYESIETITDAWKTLGINDVKHTETHSMSVGGTSSNNEKDDFFDFVWQRSSLNQSAKESTTNTSSCNSMSNCNSPANSGVHYKAVPKGGTKIIEIDIGENCRTNNGFGSTLLSLNDPTYDRLDFLTANNKTSSSYKTIVSVAAGTTSATTMAPSSSSVTSTSTASTQRQRCASPDQNDYEMIDVLDKDIIAGTTCIGRKLSAGSNESNMQHINYGILRKSTIASNYITIAKSLSPEVGITDMNTAVVSGNEVGNSLIKHNCNSLSYAIVSKPKRV